MNISHLAIAITFHFNERRLEYLSRITAAHRSLAEHVTTFIITNANTAVQIDQIKDYSNAENQIIVRPTHIGHPFLLTWCHRSVFMNLLNSDSSVTHFLYTEDDILFTLDNLNYWLTLSPVLQEYNGMPGFIRYEVDDEGSFFSSDFTKPLYLEDTFTVLDNGARLVCLEEPYQAFYFLDRDQMSDLLETEAGSPDDPSTFGMWGIREKAAQGLAFWKKNKDYPSNYFIKVSLDNFVDHRALVHHLPNTYAQISDSPYGKIRIHDCVQNAGSRKPKQSVDIWTRIKSKFIMLVN